jgi:hypothetical protein
MSLTQTVTKTARSHGMKHLLPRTIAVPWRLLASCQRTTLCTMSGRFGAPHTSASSLCAWGAELCGGHSSAHTVARLPHCVCSARHLLH